MASNQGINIHKIGNWVRNQVSRYSYLKFLRKVLNLTKKDKSKVYLNRCWKKTRYLDCNLTKALQS
jgi:hypothetical protein